MFRKLGLLSLIFATGCGGSAPTNPVTPPSPPVTPPPPPPPPPPASPLAGGTIYAGAKRSTFAGGPLTEEIVAFDPNTSAEVNLSQNPAGDRSPLVSPNGQFITIYTDRYTLGQQRQVDEPVIMNKDGSSITRLPYPCDNFFVGTGVCAKGLRWLADGRLRFVLQRPGVFPTSYQVGTLTPLSGSPTVVVVDGAAPGALGVPSPNGTLYAGNVSGTALMVGNFPGTSWSQLAPACSFATTCTQEPVWATNGAYVYQVRQGAIWEFAVSGGGSRQLYASASPLSHLAVSPNGLSLAFIEGFDFYQGGFVKIRSIAGTSNPATVFQPVTTGHSTPYIADNDLVWSPDGKSLAFKTGDGGLGTEDITAVNTNGTGLRKVANIRLGTYGLTWGQ